MEAVREDDFLGTMTGDMNDTTRLNITKIHSFDSMSRRNPVHFQHLRSDLMYFGFRSLFTYVYLFCMRLLGHNNTTARPFDQNNTSDNGI